MDRSRQAVETHPDARCLSYLDMGLTTESACWQPMDVWSAEAIRSTVLHVRQTLSVKAASVSPEDIDFASAPGDAPSGILLNERRLTMKFFMVLTSHNVPGNTGKPTGFRLEEFTAPYYVFTDARVEITVASVKGGQSPIDPKSDEPGNQTDSMERFKKDSAA